MNFVSEPWGESRIRIEASGRVQLAKNWIEDVVVLTMSENKSDDWIESATMC